MPDDSNPFGSLTGSPLSMRDAPPLDLSDSPKPAEKKPSAPKAVAPLAPKEETPPKKEPPAEGPVPQGGIPRAPELTPPPVAQSTDPLHQWGSIAMIVAGLGSLLTRSHATTALNAAAGVMKGFHQNDLEAANTAFQEWKVANENTTKMANYELQAYKAMMADKKLGLDAIRTQAEAMKDYATIEHLKVSDDPEILFAKKQKIIDDSITAGQKLDAGMTRINAQDEWRKDYATKNGHPPSADEQNTHMNNLLPAGTSPLAQERSAQLATHKAAMAEFDRLHPDAQAGDRAIESARLMHPEKMMTDEEEAGTIELLHQGKYPISAYTLRTPEGRKLLADAQKKYPDIDPRDYQVGIAVKKWAEAGKGADQIQNLNTIQQHLQNLTEVAGALHNQEYRAISAVGNRLGLEMGDDAKTNYETVVKFISGELSRVIVGGGSSPGTRADRDQFEEAFNSSDSPEQLLGAIDHTKSLIYGRMESLVTRFKAGGLDPFGPKGGLNPDMIEFLRTSTSGAVRGAGPSNPQERIDSIEAAKTAITKGADRAATIAMLRAHGFEDLEMQERHLDTSGM